MAIRVPARQFANAPEGQHLSVLVDVVDLGLVESTWGAETKIQPKVRFVWELATTQPDGRHYLASKRYTSSSHAKSQLFKDLRTWQGKLTSEELAKLDLETLLGVPCYLVIQHDEKEGTTYANVVAVLKADQGTSLAPSGKYVRVKDRPSAAPSNGDNEDAPWEHDAQGAQPSTPPGGNGNQTSTPAGASLHPNRTFEVIVDGKLIHTAGIGQPTLLRVWDALRRYEAKPPGKPGTGKALLKQLSGVDDSKDLDESEGQQLVQTIDRMLTPTTAAVEEDTPY